MSASVDLTQFADRAVGLMELAAQTLHRLSMSENA